MSTWFWASNTTQIEPRTQVVSQNARLKRASLYRSFGITKCDHVFAHWETIPWEISLM